MNALQAALFLYRFGFIECRRDVCEGATTDNGHHHRHTLEETARWARDNGLSTVTRERVRQQEELALRELRGLAANVVALP